MRHQAKLGRLVVGEPPSNDKPRRTANRHRLLWPGLVAVGVCVALLTLGWLTGWLPAQFVPRQLIIRGCCLSDADAIATALQASGAENYWQLWRQAQAAPPTDLPWVEHISSRPLPDRTLLVTVTERLPLLATVAGGQRYWLCDDGQLVKADVGGFKADALSSLATRPTLHLPDDPGAGPLKNAELLLSIAANCATALPEKIASIELNRQGEVTLYDKGGLELRLGSSGDYQTKIAALPKALRICEANRASLRYLDATDPRVFYQKWNHTISNQTAGAQDPSGQSGR
jgi:cell division septal protein FtsQ